MTTQAYFENIQAQIKKELLKATQSIIVVVAWFTDGELYDVLCNKVKEGLSVSVLISNDRINTGSNGLDIDRLNNLGGEFNLIEENGRKRMMHNKFCIIDNDIVITGSYNWTRRAQSNDENIVVTKGSGELANEYLLTFLELKKKRFGKIDYKFDLTQICKRLEILRSTISIQDEEDISYQLKRLKKLFDIPLNIPRLNTLSDIIKSAEKKEYGKTILFIDEFLKEFSRLIVYVDPEIAGLKLEIKSLELQISSLEDERSEMEKLIYAFDVRHNLELGEIISKILGLRKQIAKREADENPEDESAQEEFREAQDEYQNYREGFEESKKLNVYELSPDEQKELTKKFRRASKLCHPDVVADIFKDEAGNLFNELKTAFDQNDLERVNTILDHLETGKPFKAKHETVTKKDVIKNTVNSMRQLLSDLIKQVTDLKNSDTFLSISKIPNWDDYFNQTKQQLIEELERIKNEYEQE